MSEIVNPKTIIESWPVQLFRYIPSVGWEKYQETHPINESNSNPWSSIYATPKKNCIEIKKLRLRIHLFAHSSSSSKSEESKAQNTEPATSIPRQHATVVQRSDTLFITASRGTIGAVVLRFESTTQCLEFSNRLVSLNAQVVANVPLKEEAIDSSSSSKLPVDSVMVPYLVQMLHDPSFVQLVQYMDTVVQSIPGGQEMLKALEQFPKS